MVRVLENDSAFVTAKLIGTPATPPVDTVIPATGKIPDGAKFSGGDDGTVLQPNAGNFETAVLPPSGTGGVYLLDQVNIFNLLCVPGENTPAVIQELEGFCHDQRRRAFLDRSGRAGCG